MPKIAPVTDKMFTKEIVNALVPKQHVNRVSRLTVRNSKTQQNARQLKAVDGSAIEANRDYSLKPLKQPGVVEKKQQEHSIRSRRTQSQVKELFVREIWGEGLKSALLKQPIWRISRVTCSKDLRHWTAHWLIDDDQERKRYEGKINEELHKWGPFFRQVLVKCVKTRPSPELVFKTEDYKDAYTQTCQ